MRSLFRSSRLIAGVFLLLVWHSLAKGQGPAPQSTPAASTSLAAISANDLILVKVFQEDDLESTLRVAEDGTITFPLIGKIKVQDRTPQEAATLIRERLMDGYLKNPQITVTVIDHNKRRFTVLGQVQRPGSYDMPDRDSLSLLQGIGMAGGYTSIANPKKIILKRRVNGRETVYKVNAEKMASGDVSSTFQVLPGDVITVTESWF
jgi:protein involved in polysaccharide export with SLBB domain